MSRGGFCRNAFGNRNRLDKINFMEDLSASVSSEKILFLQTITDAIHNYLFAFLGRNGTSAEEFAFAHEYLFRVRSYDPATWADRGSRTEAQMKDMCFDVHYEMSGLSYWMDIDKFLRDLRNYRREIVEDNRDQVLEYLGILYSKACLEAHPGHQLPLPLGDRLDALSSPNSPADIARLLFLPKRYLSEPIRQKDRCRRGKRKDEAPTESKRHCRSQSAD
jgi:hypothetical protein